MFKQLLFSALFFLVFAQISIAQAPPSFKYSAVATDKDNQPLFGDVSVKFLFHEDSETGQIRYSEAHNITLSNNGKFNLEVGRGTPVSGQFNEVDWAQHQYWLQVQLASNGGALENFGTSQLLSVPYALYAAQAPGDDWGKQTAIVGSTLVGDGLAGSPLDIAQQNAQTGQVLKWNGTTWVPANDTNSGGTVTQINTGAGLIGGPISTNGTIRIADSPVAPGQYGGKTQIPVITVDQQGRLTNVFNESIEPSAFNLIDGPGIGVQKIGFNYTITNTGDTNGADDVLQSTFFAGDVTGVYSDIQLRPGTVGTSEIVDNTVSSSDIEDNTIGSQDLANGAIVTAKLADGSVTAPKLSNMGAFNGQVLKWNGTTWVPAADNIGSELNLIEGTGVGITGTAPNLTITNTGDTNAADDLTMNSAANGDVTGPFSNLQVKADVVTTTELADNSVETANLANQAVTGGKIDDMGAANGQVLKWNGAIWAPADDNTSSGPTSIVTNTTLVGTGSASSPLAIAQQGAANGQVLSWNGSSWLPATVPGDQWGAQSATTNATLTGNGTAANPLAIAQQGAVNGQVLRWNGSSWLPATVPGDNWGAQSATTNATLTGNGTAASPLAIAQQGAVNGQVLSWNGSIWLPATVPGDQWGTQSAITNATLTGNGTAASPLALAQQSASNGQVLKWNGTAWAPATDNVGTPLNLIEGTGIDITGTAPNLTITNIGDTNAADDLTTSSTSNGDVTGLFSNLQIKADVVTTNELADNAVETANLASKAVTGGKIDDMGATSGQVLKWNGTTWAPANDNTGTGLNLVAGPGVSITGTSPNLTINNIGDTNAGDDLTTGSAFAGDISGTFQAVSVNKIKGRPIGGMPPNTTQALVYNPSADGNQGGYEYAAPGGDVSGSDITNLQVTRLRGRPIGGMPPNTTQALVYNPASGGSWDYATPGGDLAGNDFNNIQLASIQGIPVDIPGSGALGDGMVLACKDNGSGGLEFRCVAGGGGGFNIPYTYNNAAGSSTMFNLTNTSTTAQYGMAVTNNSTGANTAAVIGSGRGVNATWDPNTTSSSGVSLGNANFYYPAGVYGLNTNPGSNSTAGAGVLGRAMGNNNNKGVGGWFQGGSVGTFGGSYTGSFAGVLGWCQQGSYGGAFYLNPPAGASKGSSYSALYAKTFNSVISYAGYFVGDVHVNGNLTKASGNFMIDHPQDPAEKYLYHSFVESPDMKNIYDGVVTTDAQGYAVVELPGYFESLNKDFRYQLTCMGDFSQAIISKKIEHNRFVIRTEKPHMEVSWQVTGIRKDPWAQAHPTIPEVDKKGSDRGKYLHPELYGQPQELQIGDQKEKQF